MPIDTLDAQIIWELDRNARRPLTEVADELKISKQSLHYRLKKINEQGIIQSYIPIIDIHHIGYLTFRVYFKYRNLHRAQGKQVLSYFIKHSHTLWVASLEGAWDLEVVFTARNFIHFNNLLKAALTQLGRFYHKYNLSMTPVCYAFRRDYLVNAARQDFATSYYGFEPQPQKLQFNDFRILTRLTKDARISIEELGQKTGLAFPTIRRHIQTMEELKVIQGYRLLLDRTKIGRKYYKALLYLENLNEKIEREIYRFCSKKSFVIYLTEVLGDWQMEIEAEVLDLHESTGLLQELRHNFSDNFIEYDLVEVVMENKLNYFPMGEEIIKDIVGKARPIW